MRLFGNAKPRWTWCAAPALAIVLLLSVGCASRGAFPHSSNTQIDLGQRNFRVVKTNAVGRSYGFSLLGLLPIWSPTYTTAMERLYRDAGVREGEAQVVINVAQEQSSLYLILFSVPRLTLRADMVEFTDTPASGGRRNDW